MFSATNSSRESKLFLRIRDNKCFQRMRENDLDGFRSELDVALRKAVAMEKIIRGNHVTRPRG